MVPPVAAALLFGVHVVRSRKVTDRDYVPPAALWVALIWGFKILAPLIGETKASSNKNVTTPTKASSNKTESFVLTQFWALTLSQVYVFIQVRADQFVKYDNMAQKMCEVSISLVLYPPGSMEFDKLTLTYDSEQQFEVTNAFTDLRNVTKLYFANAANHLFSSKQRNNDADFDFESELANLNILGIAESRRSLPLDLKAADVLRRAAAGVTIALTITVTVTITFIITITITVTKKTTACVWRQTGGRSAITIRSPSPPLAAGT